MAKLGLKNNQAVNTDLTGEPPFDCPLCPRLAAFRHENRIKFPDYWNNPVPSFGKDSAQLLVVGLAPGLHGANQTGRPFTNDYAGDLLYPTLIKFGFAKGNYQAVADDGLKLINCQITNAVRCVPLQNKPLPEEITTCRPFLIDKLQHMQKLHVIVALGGIAHQSVLKTYGQKLSQFKFGHGAEHQITENLLLIDSYHCSRYNTNTGVLTTKMFEAVFNRVRDLLS